MGNTATSVWGPEEGYGEGLPDSDDLFKTLAFPKVDLPLSTNPDYVVSFALSQREEILNFLKTYGFVVIDEILSEEECQKSIDEVWTLLETTERVHRDETRTWDNKSFPGGMIGIVGGDVTSSKQMWINRQNPKLYEAFQLIYGEDALWVSLDRCGLMRPTKKVPIGRLAPDKFRGLTMTPADPSAELLDHPEWKTTPLWLHWDLNPWAWTSSTNGIDYEFSDFISENNGSRNDGKLKLQGLLNFVDNKKGDGGFCTVPGFHKYLKDYCAQSANTSYGRRKSVPGADFTYAKVLKGDYMEQQVEKIACRAGSLIVWMGEQPHCNYPNDSSRFRINQYVKMFPAKEGMKGTDERRDLVLKMTSPYRDSLTPLGRKLLGLDTW